MRLANEAHAVLLSGVRGEEATPGRLRTRQVWIGTPGTPIERASFVPPPPQLLSDLLGDWERFVNAELVMPPLIQAALMHYQFEAIHPYRDGNGRIGRLLVILFLQARDVLAAPLLYLSAFFERHRSAYYDHLSSVSTAGDWEGWLAFFLEGVTDQANDALLRSRRVRDLHARYREMLQSRGESANGFRLVDALFGNPFVTGPLAARLLGVSRAGARRILDRLVKAGLLEYEAGAWPRLYVAKELLQAIEES